MSKAHPTSVTVQAVFLLLIFLAPPLSMAGQPVTASFATARSSFERLSSDSKATREQWDYVISSFLEIYRSKKEPQIAIQSLLFAGRASLQLYRRGGNARDVDRAIEYLNEFTRTTRSGPYRILGLRELKDAHLLKQRISKASRAGRGTNLSAQAVVANTPTFQSSEKPQQSLNSGRNYQGRPPWAAAAKASPPFSRYKYTGNPFWTSATVRWNNPERLEPSRERPTTTAGVAIPKAVVQPDDTRSVRDNSGLTDPDQQPILKESAPCPPKPLSTPPSENALTGVKSASLPPTPSGAASPDKRTVEKCPKEFVVVIDPGHGGKDPGAVSKDGRLKEKDLTLEIATRVKKRLMSHAPGIKVELTRTEDRFLTLQERTAFANSLNADLFISLHCNAASDSSSKGIETFYLSKASSRRAMRLAAKENGIPLSTMSDLEATLLDLMLTSKKLESDKLADTVHKTLVKDLVKTAPKIRDRGVKRAPFYVLLGATMPAILVECAFISNGREEQKLMSGQYLDSVASGIATGAAAYLRGLGGKS